MTETADLDSPGQPENWAPQDQLQALADGWGLFDNSNHGYRIERHDAAQRFDCDAAAVAYVGHRAVMGDRLCQKAFAELAWQHAVSDAAEQAINPDIV